LPGFWAYQLTPFCVVYVPYYLNFIFSVISQLAATPISLASDSDFYIDGVPAQLHEYNTKQMVDEQGQNPRVWIGAAQSGRNEIAPLRNFSYICVNRRHNSGKAWPQERLYWNVI